MNSFLKKIFKASPSAPDREVSRNEPCWCGSGEKYKRCHMEKDLHRQRMQAAACRKYS